MNKRRIKIIVTIFAVALLLSYVVAYRLLVEPHTFILLGPHTVPVYNGYGEYEEILQIIFEPIHQIDRLIRPDVWQFS